MRKGKENGCSILLALTLAIAQTFSPLAVAAQTVPNNLDLSSTSPTEVAKHAATITVNGSAMEVAVNDLLTPAQRVAVSQVHYTGTQNIVIGADGSAIGGTFNLSAAAKNGVSSLVIPQNVIAVQDVARLSNINIVSDLVNSGTLQVLSQNSAASAASIAAQNILNQQGASISSILPAGGVPGYTSVLNNISMTLSALQNLTNMGSITSSADLTAIAGGTITNSLQGLPGPAPVMQAMNNLNLITGGGTTITSGINIAPNILNNGLLSSLAGNINFSTITNADLTIANLNGQIQALAGQVNFRDSTYSAINNLIVWQGDVAANAVNINSGAGISQLNVQSISGLVNMYTGSGNLGVAIGDLAIGSVVNASDTNIANISGNIILHNDINTNGQVLRIAAGQDISTATPGLKISTSSLLSSGGALLLAAGPSISIPVLGQSSPILATHSQNEAAISFQFNSMSASGGNLNFAAMPLAEISSAGTEGGAVTLFARANNGNRGELKLPEGLNLTTKGNTSYGSLRLEAESIETGNLGNSANFAAGETFVDFESSAVFGSIAVDGKLTVLSSNGSLELRDNSTWSAPAIVSEAQSIRFGANTHLWADEPISGSNTGRIQLITNKLILPDNSEVVLHVKDGYADINGFVNSGAPRTLEVTSTTLGAPSTLRIQNSAPTARHMVSGGDVNYTSALMLGGSIAINPGVTIDIPGNLVTRVFATGAAYFNNEGSVVSRSSTGADFRMLTSQGPIDINFGKLDFTPKDSAGGNGGQFIVDGANGLSAGHLNVLGQKISVSANSTGNFDGGMLSINALSVQVSGQDPLELSANGTGNGNGGKIAITTSDPLSGLSFGNSSGQISTAATGGSTGAGTGDAGEIIIESAGAVFLDGAAITSQSLSSNGKGGAVSIAAGGVLNMSTGILNVSGTGVKDGGKISIQAESYAGGQLIANGGETGGNGGTIELKVNSGNIAIGDGTGELKVSVTGGGPTSEAGNAGEISIDVGGEIAVNHASGIQTKVLGANGAGAKLVLTAGSAMTLAGGLSAEGKGVGDGGVIELTFTNDDSAFELDAANQLSVDAGSSQGNGGSILVLNNGIGGISLKADGGLSAQGSIGGGNGGEIYLSTPYGALSIERDVDASASAGDSDGGRVIMEGGQLALLGANEITFSANASGSGRGGLVDVAAYNSNADLDLGLGGGKFKVSAEGGSAGSTAGDGGTLSVFAGGNLTIDSTHLRIAPQGSSGAGAKMFLVGGGSGLGDLKVIGSLSANSVGEANAGSIELRYNDDINPFTIGNVSLAHSGVTGNITAQAFGAGDGGSIFISNLSTTPGSTLAIQAESDVSTASQSGMLGSLNFIYSTSLALDIESSGKFDGRIGSDNTSVSIKTIAPTQTLTLEAIYASEGVINISTAANGSIVVFDQSSFLQSAGDIVISSPKLTNNGALYSSNSILISNPAGSDGLTVDGSNGLFQLTGFGGTPSINVEASGNSSLTLGGSQTYAPNFFGGTLAFKANSISLASNSSLTISEGKGQFIAKDVYFGSSASIRSNNAFDGPGIYITSGNLHSELNIHLPSDGSASLSSFPSFDNSAVIVIDASSMAPISFLADGSGRLNFLGTQSLISSNGADIVIGSTATLATDYVLDLVSIGASININGTLESQAPIESDKTPTINLLASNVTIAGSIAVRPTDLVTARPDSDVIISIGGNVKGPGFAFSTADLQHVKSGIFKVGALDLTAGVNVIDDLDLTSGGPTTLAFETGSNYDATGRTLNLSSSSLAVHALGQLVSGTINTIDSNVSLRSDELQLGSINVGKGTVSLLPVSELAVEVGSAAHSPGVYSVTNSELMQISAGTLQIGDRLLAGGFSLMSDLDVSGSGAGAGSYNLAFYNAGAFDAASKSIILGAKNLSIRVQGEAQLGAVTASSASTLLVESENIFLNAPIDMGNGNVVLKQSTDLPIVLGGATLTPGAFNITASDLQLITADTLSIGDIRKGTGIILAGSIDTSAATGPGAFNLELENLGSLERNGFTFNRGSHNVSLFMDGGASNISTGDLDLGRVLQADSPALIAGIGFSAIAGGSIRTTMTSPVTVDPPGMTFVAGANITAEIDWDTFFSQRGGDIDLPNVSLHGTDGDVRIEARGGADAQGYVSLADITIDNSTNTQNIEVNGSHDVLLGNITHISANGADNFGFSGDAENGISSPNITISSEAGNITLGSIIAKGGNGGSMLGCCGGGAGGQGGNGANVLLHAQNGGVKINGEVNISGGEGGHAGYAVEFFGAVVSPTGLGGDGGRGGNLTVQADNGSIEIGVISAFGGNGGDGNWGRANGGSGGNGGQGGNITLTSKSGQILVNSVNSSGGGGGGTPGSFLACCAESPVQAGGGGGGGGAGFIKLTADESIKVAGNILSTGGGGGGGTLGNYYPSLAGRSGGDSGDGLAQGGAAGQVLDHPTFQQLGSGGGGGGAGASIELKSKFGSITSAGMINSSGGGGGGGGGGFFPNPYTGGQGGSGGDAGTINLYTAMGTISVDGPVLAAGGGGGGQGGMGPYGGGGGGSFGGGGGAGNGNVWADLIVARGSAGGGGGIGGGENGSNYLSVGAAGGSTTRGMAGTGETGIITSGSTHGAGGTFGQGGGAGGPSAGFGGDIGLPGQSVSVQFEGSPQPVVLNGGRGGVSGAVAITGREIALTKSVGSLYASPYDAHSIISIGSNPSLPGEPLVLNGSVTLTRWGTVGTERYGVDGDLSSSAKTVAAQIVTKAPVTINQPISGASGVAGSVLSASLGNASIAQLNIKESNQLLEIQHNDLLTPSEWIFAVQDANDSADQLVLGVNGTAQSGDITIGENNLPDGGSFSNLVVPEHVTMTIGVSKISVSDSIDFQGTINRSSDKTTLSLSAGSDVVIGANSVLSLMGTEENTSGATVDITADSKIEVRGQLLTHGSKEGSGGSITLTSPTLVLSGNVSLISESGNSGGAGGAISVFAHDIQLDGDSHIKIRSGGFTQGGDILIDPADFTMQFGQELDLLSILSDPNQQIAYIPKAGNIALEFHNLKMFGGRMSIDASAGSDFEAGPGSGGNINFLVTGTYEIAAGNILLKNGGLSAGNTVININEIKDHALFDPSGSLQVLSNAENNESGSAAAGSISLFISQYRLAHANILLDTSGYVGAPAGDVSVEVSSGTRLNLAALDPINGGSVTISASGTNEETSNRVTVYSGIPVIILPGGIDASSNNSNPIALPAWNGLGGDVLISGPRSEGITQPAPEVIFDGRTSGGSLVVISASGRGNFDGGLIDVVANQITFRNSPHIEAQGGNNGAQGGSVLIAATDPDSSIVLTAGTRIDANGVVGLTDEGLINPIGGSVRLAAGRYIEVQETAVINVFGQALEGSTPGIALQTTGLTTDPKTITINGNLLADTFTGGTNQRIKLSNSGNGSLSVTGTGEFLSGAFDSFRAPLLDDNGAYRLGKIEIMDTGRLTVLFGGVFGGVLEAQAGKIDFILTQSNLPLFVQSAAATNGDVTLDNNLSQQTLVLLPQASITTQPTFSVDNKGNQVRTDTIRIFSGKHLIIHGEGEIHDGLFVAHPVITPDVPLGSSPLTSAGIVSIRAVNDVLMFGPVVAAVSIAVDSLQGSIIQEDARKFTAPSINMQAMNNIGSDTNGPVLTVAQSIQLTAVNGLVNVRDTSLLPTAVEGSAGTSFSFEANSGLTVKNVSASQGSVVLGTNEGDLTIDPVVLFAIEGNVELFNSDNAGQIVIKNQAVISALTNDAGNRNIGNVWIHRGDKFASVAQTTPQITVNMPPNTYLDLDRAGRGEIFFGDGITVNPTPVKNRLIAINRTVGFDSQGSSSNIILEGRSVIEAIGPDDVQDQQKLGTLVFIGSAAALTLVTLLALSATGAITITAPLALTTASSGVPAITGGLLIPSTALSTTLAGVAIPAGLDVVVAGAAGSSLAYYVAGGMDVAGHLRFENAASTLLTVPQGGITTSANQSSINSTGNLTLVSSDPVTIAASSVIGAAVGGKLQISGTSANASIINNGLLAGTEIIFSGHQSGSAHTALQGNGQVHADHIFSIGNSGGNASQSMQVSPQAGSSAVSMSLITPTDGNFYVHSSGETVLDHVEGGQKVFIRSAGNIDVKNPGDPVDLDIATDVGSNASITLGADLIATNSITLHADGSGGIIQAGGRLIAPHIVLSSGSGNLGSEVARVIVEGDSLNILTSGSAYILSINSIQIDDTKVGGTFNLLSNGDISVPNQVTAGETHLLTDVGSINIAGTILASQRFLAQANTGNFVSSLGSIQLEPAATAIVSARSMQLGSISGGSSVILVADQNIQLTDSVLSPGGYLYLYGNTLSSGVGVSLNAHQVTFNSIGAAPITIAEGAAAGVSGFAISQNLLNGTTAQMVQVGNGSATNIAVQGNVDLSSSNIGQLYAYTSGSYSASGADLTIASGKTLYVNAGSIDTGSVAGGAQGIYVANTGNLNLSGNLNSPDGYLYLYGNTLSSATGVSLNAHQVTFNSIGAAPITIAEGAAAGVSGFAISQNLLNGTTALMVQVGNGSATNISVQGNVDLSSSNIGQLYVYTSGSYSASGAALTIASGKTLYVNAGSIDTGSVAGGAQGIYVANTGNLNLSGNLNSPGGYLYLYGNTLSSGTGVSLNAHQVTFNSIGAAPITIAEGAAASVSGFAISQNLLNGTTAQMVQVGNGSATNIAVQGNVDLSSSNIGQLYAYTSGSYSASGADLTIASGKTLYVNAGSIDTGSVAGGAQGIYVANTGNLNLSGNLNSPGGYLYLYGNTLSSGVGVSLNAHQVTFNSIGAAPITIAEGAAAGVSGFAISQNILNGTTAQMVQVGNGSATNIAVQGNVDLSSSNIGQLYAYTSGSYSASGADLTIASGKTLYVNAGSIDTGSVAGGAQGIYVANTGNLNVSGNLNSPGGYLYLYGNTLSSGTGVSLNAHQVTFNSIGAAPITIAEGAAAGVSGFAISQNLLNGTTAQMVQVGNGSATNIAMQGNVDLSSSNIGQLYAYTSGSYSASGADLTIASGKTLYVNAGSIDTGSVAGGAQGIYVANTGNLNVSGNLNSPGGYLYLYGNTLSSGTGVSLNAHQVTFNSIGAAPITIAEGAAAGVSGFAISQNLLNGTTAQMVQVGNGSATNIAVQGNVDLSSSNIGQLYAYTSGSYSASGAALTIASGKTLYVNAGSIDTGSVAGGAQGIYVANTGNLNLSGNLNSPGGYLYLYGNTLSSGTGVSLNAHQVTFNSIGAAPITIAEGAAAGVSGFAISQNILNGTTAQMVQVGNGSATNIAMQGNVDLSSSNIGQLYAYTSGSYSASGAALTIASGKTLYVNAGSIDTGSVAGGAQGIYVANTGNLNVSGNLNSPGGYLYLYGNTLSSGVGVSLNAHQVTFNSIGAAPITIAEGGAAGVSGFAISQNILNGTTAQMVQVGNGSATNIAVQGNVDLSSSNIGQLYAYTSGSYSASGAALTIASGKTLYVNAGSIDTGSVAGGAQGIYVANTGNLNLSGNLNSPDGYLYLYGNTLSSATGVSLNAHQVTFNSIGAAPITIAEGAAAGVSGFAISQNLLNGTTAQMVQVGNGSATNISVQGNVDLSSSNIGQLYVYTSGSYSGTNSKTILATNMTWYVNAGISTTGAISGGNSIIFTSPGQITVDGNLESNQVILDGNPVVYTPISFTQPLLGARDSDQPKAMVGSTKFTNFWRSQQSKLGRMHNDELIVVDGEVLVEMKNNGSIWMPLGQLLCKKGAIVRIKAAGSQSSIQVLHESGSNSITFVQNKRAYALRSGEELLVADSKSSLNILLAIECHGRRLTHYAESGRIVTSEFSLLSLAGRSHLLSHVLKNSGKIERNVFRKVLTTHASLGIVSSKHGPYICN